MRKLTVFLIVIFACGLLFAQNVTETFTYTDSWTFVTPLYLPDGTTPMPGGYLIEVCLPVVPGVMDYDNDWHGPALTNNGSVQQIEPGFDGFFLFSPAFTWFQPGGGTEPCANTGESIYLRIYDAVDVASAIHYMNSDWLLGLAGGPYDTEVGVWNAWEPIGGGVPGYGSGSSDGSGDPVFIDVEPIDLGGSRVMVDPDMDFQPCAVIVDFEVQVGDVAINTIPYPENVGISYLYTITGDISSCTEVCFTLYNLDDLLSMPDMAVWFNGTNWNYIPTADWSTPDQVSFCIPIPNTRDGAGEIVSYDRYIYRKKN